MGPVHGGAFMGPREVQPSLVPIQRQPAYSWPSPVVGSSWLAGMSAMGPAWALASVVNDRAVEERRGMRAAGISNCAPGPCVVPSTVVGPGEHCWLCCASRPTLLLFHYSYYECQKRPLK